MTLKIEGLQNLEKTLGKVRASKTEALQRGVLKAGLHLQKTSQEQVPVDTGALKSSAYTELNEKPVRGSGVGGYIQRVTNSIYRTVTRRALYPEVRVGYTQEYAIYVHEDLGANHPVGKAKFLEDPIRTEQKRMVSIVKEEITDAP